MYLPFGKILKAVSADINENFSKYNQDDFTKLAFAMIEYPAIVLDEGEEGLKNSFAWSITMNTELNILTKLTPESQISGDLTVKQRIELLKDEKNRIAKLQQAAENILVKADWETVEQYYKLAIDKGDYAADTWIINR